MNIFNKYPRFFRTALVMFAVGMSVPRLVRLAEDAATPTDENVFQTRLVITALEAGSPAAEAGVQVGDMLLSINNKSFADSAAAADALTEAIEKTDTDEPIHLATLRGGERQEYGLPKGADPGIEVGRRLVITFIEKNGASDRSGLNVGDLILSINSKTFRTALEADRLMRQGIPDQTINYVIQRGERAMTVRVQLAKVGIDFSLVLLMMLSLSVAGLGVFAGLSRPESKGARLLAVSLVSLSPLFMITANAAPELYAFALFIGIPMSIHASLYFPKAGENFDAQRKVIVGLYLLGGLALSFVLGDGSLTAGISKDTFNVFILIGYSVLLIAGGSYINAKDDGETRKVKQFINGSFAFLGTAIALANGLTPAFGKRALYFGLLAAAVPLAYFYTIARYRIYGISPVIKRSLRYSMLSAALLLGGLILSLNLIAQLMKVEFSEPLGVRFGLTNITFFSAKGDALAARDGERFAFLFIGIVLAVALMFLRRTVWRFLNRWFDRQGYDYKRALAELSDVLAKNLDTAELAASIADDVKRFMRLKGVVVYLKGQGNYALSAATGSWKNNSSLNPNDLYLYASELTEPRPVSDSLPMFEALDAAEIQFIVPMMIKDRQVGLLLLAEKRSEEIYKKDDIAFIESLARQAAIAFENARLAEDARQKRQLKRELEFASKVQHELLPQRKPEVAGLDISGMYSAAGDVGGDYYDFILAPVRPDKIPNKTHASHNLNSGLKSAASGLKSAASGLNGEAKPESVMVLVGDVAGKGISAAMQMSRVQGIIRSLSRLGSASPKELMQKTNEIVYSASARSSYITMICGHFDTPSRTLSLVRAGHLPMLWYSASAKKLRVMKPQGMGIGLDAGARFNAALAEEKIVYGDGDLFAFFSDGVTEAMNPQKEEFGIERLGELLTEYAALGAKEILAKIENALIDFVGNAEQHDDITLLVLKATPVTVSASDAPVTATPEAAPVQPEPVTTLA